MGIAAIEGNGQSELVEAICGMRPIQGGQVLVEGKRINGMDPGAVRALGLSHVPEDRLRTGVSRQAAAMGKPDRRAAAAAGLQAPEAST